MVTCIHTSSHDIHTCTGQHSQKHLDALLGAARLEVFLPHVDILAAGEVVNELCVVVGGVVEVVPVPADDSDSLQAAAHAPRIVQEGELFGEVAFFTETAQVCCCTWTVCMHVCICACMCACMCMCVWGGVCCG